jgi:hypothetical protein
MADITLCYYSHNTVPDTFRDAVLMRLNVVADNIGADRVACVREYIDSVPARKWTQLVQESVCAGGMDQDTRIASCLRVVGTGLVALVEHDVLYPADYLSELPREACAMGGYWYDMNTAIVNEYGYWMAHKTLTSCMCANRDLLQRHFVRRIEARKAGERIVWDEPGKDLPNSQPVQGYVGDTPVIDVRWGGNMTGHRDWPQYADRLDGWPSHAEVWAGIGLGNKDIS